MCGICGFTGKPDNRDDVIRRMTEVITHRGPDSDGFFSDEYIAMGFRRLSIIDLETGSQPIFNEDKTMVLTFNGEIYNYRQLRRELTEKGHQFATDSDSEVLIHGFEEWKEDLLPRLRGMFAFAVYNTTDQSLFMARDFFGIKPLHYTQIGNDFVYASEIKSILEHPNFEKRFNMRALDSYLSFQYAVPPETFFEDVYCLLPGHYLWYQNGYVETERYFDPRFRPKENMTEQEAVDKIEKVFENSVNAHKIADVEVGCFLSSGVDSSYVASYFSGQKTFTVGFDFGEKYNEISWAESVSKLIDTEHHTHLISGEEFWDAVPTVQYYMDQPLADPSCVALYFVSRLASKYVKVVLSGEGADELFGGYTCYNDPRVFKTYQKLTPHVFRKGARFLARKLPDIKGRDYVIRACDKLEDRYIGNAFMYDLKEKQKLLKKPSVATAPQRLTRRHYYRSRRYDDVTKMQYLDLNMWMTGDILLKADRMSMANSLELRVPFLDKEVYKVAASLPTHLRVNKSNTKYALRKAAARHLPETTAEKEKLGFPVPTRVWLRDEKYYNIVKNTFQSETAEKFFNTDVLVAWLDQHFSGKEDNSRRVWTVYVFLIWYQIYFNDANATAEKPVNHLDELKKAADLKRENKRFAANMPAQDADEPDGEMPGRETDSPVQPPEGTAAPKSMLDLIPSLNDIPVPALHKPPTDDGKADGAEDTEETPADKDSESAKDELWTTDDSEPEEEDGSANSETAGQAEEEPLSADDLADIFGEPLALETDETDGEPANLILKTWEDAFEAPLPETEEEAGGDAEKPGEEAEAAPEEPGEEAEAALEEPSEEAEAAPEEPDKEAEAAPEEPGEETVSEWDDDEFDEDDDDEFDEWDDDEFDEDDDDEFDEWDDDEFDEDDDDDDAFEAEANEQSDGDSTVAGDEVTASESPSEAALGLAEAPENESSKNNLSDAENNDNNDTNDETPGSGEENEAPDAGNNNEDNGAFDSGDDEEEDDEFDSDDDDEDDDEFDSDDDEDDDAFDSDDDEDDDALDSDDDEDDDAFDSDDDDDDDEFDSDDEDDDAFDSDDDEDDDAFDSDDDSEDENVSDSDDDSADSGQKDSGEEASPSGLDEEEEPVTPEEAWKQEEIVPQIYEEDGEEFIDISVFSTVGREQNWQTETKPEKKKAKKFRKLLSPFVGKAKAANAESKQDWPAEDAGSENAADNAASAPDTAGETAPAKPAPEAKTEEPSEDAAPASASDEAAAADKVSEEKAPAANESGDNTGKVPQDNVAGETSDTGSDDDSDDEFDDEFDEEFDEE